MPITLKSVSTSFLLSIFTLGTSQTVTANSKLITPRQAAPTNKKQAAPPQKKGPAKNQSKKGVVELFSEAQTLFAAGKFAEALVAYDRIMKKYPGHEPTVVQYAKTLYRLDRIPESYNLFARINPQYFDPETSYEYGYASYVNQRFDAALFGFKRVPVDHPLYDLANYYGALSAIKLRRYPEAQDMLDKAVVLPDKLAQSKGLYQKHLASLRLLQEKADLEQAKNNEKQRLKQAQQASRIPVPQKSGDPAEPQAYSHQGFMSYDRFAEVKASQEHQTIDYSGYSQEQFNAQIALMQLRHGPIMPFGPLLSGGRSHATGLRLDIAIENRSTKGKKERLVAYEDSRDVAVNETVEVPSTQFTLATAGISPWVELALSQGWWLGAKGSLSFQYPDFERGQRTTKRLGGLHAGRKYNWKEISGESKLSYSFEQLTDSELEPLVDTSTPEFLSSLTFPSQTTATITASMASYNYHLDTMAGPDSVYQGKLEVEQLFPLGIKLGIAGTAAAVRNQIAINLPSFKDAAADGDTLSAEAKLTFKPISWFCAGASYKNAKTNWSVIDPQREEVFLRNVADYIDQTNFWASLQFVF